LDPIEVKAPAATTKPRVQSAARALAILSAVAASEEGLTARELAESLGLKRATVYHLVHTLVGEGFLFQGARRRVRIGFRVGALIDGFERHVVPADMAAFARRLAAQTNETAYVTVRREAALATVWSVPGAHPVSVLRSPLGPIDHAHARASGKMLLALAPEGIRAEYLANHELMPCTAATITDRDALDANFAEIRERRYSVDLGEYTEGVCCLSVPLGDSMVALSLSAPAGRFDERFDEYLQLAIAIAGSSAAAIARDE
jgi:IclR family acetate operon transcriptional repressor